MASRRATALALVLAWVTFAAGGVYRWVWMPAGLAILALAAASARRARFTGVDAALTIGAMAILFQLLPLPTWLLDEIAPQAIPLRRALWLAPPGDELPRMPISIVPSHTWEAFGIFAAAVLVFWTCRQLCEAGGPGQLVRPIAMIGLAASVAAIVQRAQSRELLYGVWRPLDAGARPFGPFVNRNHFATWAVMACPLIVGYVLARARGARKSLPLSQRIANAAMQLGSIRTWLVAAVCLLTLAVIISTSRSGVIALGAAFVVSMLISSRGQARHIRYWIALQGALVAAVILTFANFDSLMHRMDETLSAPQAGRGRAAIWRDARELIRDFGWTGTGAGTFGTAIVPYQTAEPGFTIGQAHNHYLQIAAEGGALLMVPAALSVGCFVWIFRRRLAEGDRPTYLIRAGAVSGLAGVFVQSYWETGLRMPANAFLFAALAAIAVYKATPLPIMLGETR